MSAYDMAIALRVYPRTSRTPAIFPNDKLKLVECSLKSLKASLGNLKVKLWVILDACPPEYDVLFLKYFDKKHTELLHFEGIGNQETFLKQLDILTEQDDCDIVFLAEDDYIYQADQFKEILDFMHTYEDAHFVTTYDHLDYYTEEMHNKCFKIRVSKNKHWRMATTTTCSFLTKKSILKRTKGVFRTYAKWKNTDVPIWFSLTKYNVFNPFTFIRWVFTSRVQRNFIILAWLHNFIQILFGKRWNLWAPIPSIATHLEAPFLSPTIDWNSIFDQYKN
jgi:hypothetical protein